MNIAGAPEGAVRAIRARAGSGEEIRCPSCARLLVLRSGPAITPHFAHRPRQSCRNRSDRPVVSPLRLEQLTLFDLGAPAPPDAPTWPEPTPRPSQAVAEAERITYRSGGRTAQVHRHRRRRRAWLPRLIRWIKGRPR
jgi:hypothetical protein